MNDKNQILGITSEVSENLVDNVLLNTTENALEEFAVTFTYSHWERVI